MVKKDWEPRLFWGASTAAVGLMIVATWMGVQASVADFQNTFHRSGQLAVNFDHGFSVGIVTPNLDLSIVAGYSECGLNETVSQQVDANGHATRSVNDAGWWVNVGPSCAKGVRLNNGTFGSKWDK